MGLSFLDFEIPLLQALVNLGGEAKTKDVYPEVEKIMDLSASTHPEEYEKYKFGDIKWKNKTGWAREYLKRKDQLDGNQWGIWKITDAGKERIRVFTTTKKDTDEGLAAIQGIDPDIAEDENTTPERAFENIHETGGILGVRGIVYEPINEQGVILLFAALCHDLGFMIEGIRSGFPDALLRRRNMKGTWNSCRAEFEYKSSNFKQHKHDPKGCNIVICWENDWTDCPLEVVCLKDVARKFKGGTFQ